MSDATALERLRAFLDVQENDGEPLVPLRAMSRLLSHNVELENAARRYISEVATAISDLAEAASTRYVEGDRIIDISLISNATTRIADATLEFDEELNSHGVQKLL